MSVEDIILYLIVPFIVIVGFFWSREEKRKQKEKLKEEKDQFIKDISCFKIVCVEVIEFLSGIQNGSTIYSAKVKLDDKEKFFTIFHTRNYHKAKELKKLFCIVTKDGNFFDWFFTEEEAQQRIEKLPSEYYGFVNTNGREW